MASLGIWLFGFGGLPNADFVRQTAEAFGLGGAPDWVVIAMFVVLTGTTGMFTGVALVSGLIWASWHYPITGVVYRDAGLPTWFWLLTFTFVAVAISFARAWLRLKTDSVWPPMIGDPEYTKWVAGDPGLAFVVVAAVVAVVFWLKRGELPTRACG